MSTNVQREHVNARPAIHSDGERKADLQQQWGATGWTACPSFWPFQANTLKQRETGEPASSLRPVHVDKDVL